MYDNLHMTGLQTKKRTDNPFAKKMKQKLSEQGLVQQDVADKLNTLQSTVNTYYGNPSQLKKRGVDFAYSFVRAHGFKDSESKQIVRELFFDDYKEIFGGEKLPMPNTQPVEGMVRIRSLGDISAGRTGTSYVNDSVEYAEVPISSLQGLDPGECFQLFVSGDSMTCEEVRKTIPSNSMAIFVQVGPYMKPLDGDIVSVWLESENIGVLKIWRKNEKYSLLQSYNYSHKPIVIEEGNEGIIQGILVSHTVAHGRFAKGKRK